MSVVGNRFDVVVDIRVEVLSALPFITGTLNHVIQMGYHAGRDESLPLGIEVDAPRIAGAPGKDFELVALRMVTPDACIERCAFVIGRAWLADA